MYEYGKKYIYINERYSESDVQNRYRIITFLLDREDKSQFVFEEHLGITSFLNSVSYWGKDKDKIFVELEDFSPFITKEVEKIDFKYKRGLPPIYFLQSYKLLEREIATMEKRLAENYYIKPTIPLIEKSIREKRKGMRRIRKSSYRFFEECGVKIEELELSEYSYKNHLAIETIQALLKLEENVKKIANCRTS